MQVELVDVDALVPGEGGVARPGLEAEPALVLELLLAHVLPELDSSFCFKEMETRMLKRKLSFKLIEPVRKERLESELETGSDGHGFESRRQQGFVTIESTLKSSLPLTICEHNINSF